MNKVWIFLGWLTLGFTESQAQPCGSPRCTPTPQLYNYAAGLYPYPLPPLVACVDGSRTVQFIAPLSFDAGVLGTRRIERVEVASVTNMPPGLFWDTNNANNVWTAPNAQTPIAGCLRFCGSPSQVPQPGDSVNIALRGRLEGIPFEITINYKLFVPVLNHMPAPTVVGDAAVLCRNVQQTVRFVTGGNYRPGNRLKLELSDANGNFSTPLVLDSLAASANGCGQVYNFNVALPPLPPSSFYRLRVVSTHPADTSETSGPLTLSDAPIASATALGPTDFCAGESVELASGVIAAGYRWEPGGQTTPSISVNQSGQYRLFVRNAAGCESGAEPINVVVRPVPQINLGPDRNVCGPTTLQLPTLTGGQHRWYSGGQMIAASQSLTVQESGTYVGEITAPNGCVGRDEIVVQVSPVIEVDLGPDKADCGSVLLDLGNNFDGNTFEWRRYGQNEIISQERLLTVTQSGEYIGRVISPCGDADEDTVAVTVYALPAVTLPEVVVGCGTVTLETATIFGAQYRWFNAQTGQTLPFSTPSVTLTQSGRYGVRVTDNNGCVNSDTVTVEVLPNLSVNLGADRSVCNGETLDAGNPYLGVQYRWVRTDQPDVILSTARTYFASQTGTYRVTVIAPCELTVEDEIALTVYPEPSIELGPDRPVCGSETLSILSDLPGATYRWIKTDAPNVILSQNPTYTALIPGTYVGTVNTPFGCAKSDTVSLMVTPLPQANLGPEQQVACGSTTLDAGFASVGVKYAWFRLPNLADTLGTGKKYTATQSGTYRVVVRTAGCMDAALDDVSVFILPSPNRLANWDSVRVLCNENQLSFDIPAGHWAQWSTGQTGSTVHFAETGVYWLDLTSPNGCTRSDTFFVRMDSIAATLAPVHYDCDNPRLRIENLPEGGRVKWYDADGNIVGQQATLVVQSSGRYTADVQSQYGCTQSLTTEAIIAPLSVNLGRDSVLACGGERVDLAPEVFNPAGLAVNYQWSNGATTPVLNDVPSGTYIVRVYNDYCEARDTVRVRAGNLVLSNITGNPTPKAGTTANYSVFLQNGVNYRWTTTGGEIVSGQDSNILSIRWNEADVAASPITLTVRATDANGCTSQKTFSVYVQTGVSRTSVWANAGLSVYPNPARHRAVVRVSSPSKTVVLRLTDLTGKVLYERTLEIGGTTDHVLDLSHLPPGTYVLQAGTERVRLTVGE